MTATSNQRFDAVTLEIFWRRMISAVDEGAKALRRTSFSTLVNESNDFALVRYLPNGTLDPGFESGGRVITDSGGVQEETTAMKIPCLTVREETERPVTVTEGANSLVGHDRDRLRREAVAALSGHGKRGRVPPLWDGQAAHRVVDALLAYYQDALR